MLGRCERKWPSGWNELDGRGMGVITRGLFAGWEETRCCSASSSFARGSIYVRQRSMAGRERGSAHRGSRDVKLIRLSAVIVQRRLCSSSQFSILLGETGTWALLWCCVSLWLPVFSWTNPAWAPWHVKPLKDYHSFFTFFYVTRKADV
jgi:hypothetical protein